MKTKKTFSIIPYIIQVFRIQLIIFSRAFLLISTPGNLEPEDNSLYEIMIDILNTHPEDENMFSKPKNVNFLGKFLYFLWIQLSGIVPLVIGTIMVCIKVCIKICQYCFLIFFSTLFTIIIIFLKLFKSITTFSFTNTLASNLKLHKL